MFLNCGLIFAKVNSELVFIVSGAIFLIPNPNEAVLPRSAMEEDVHIFTWEPKDTATQANLIGQECQV